MIAHRTEPSGSKLLALAVFAATAAGQPRGGQLYIWDGEAGDGLFFNSTNWDPNALPGPDDEALIDTGGPVTAASLPIEVARLTVETALNLSSSSIHVSVLSSVNNLTAGGCCAVEIDSGGEALIIKGNSSFSRRALFLGQNTRIQDLCVFADGTTVRTGSSLTINGIARFLGGTHTLETGGAATIEGTLNLQDANLFSANNPSAVWSFESGALVATGPDTSVVTDPMVMSNGRIESDGSTLVIGGAISVTDSVVSVTNDATIAINAGPGLPHQLGITSFEGSGIISIGGGNYALSPSGGITAANVSGLGLEISGGLNLHGTLSNTAILRLDSAIIETSGGSLSCDDGTVFVDASSALRAPTTVRSGAVLDVNANLEAQDLIRINSGGLMRLNRSIVAGALPFPRGRIEVNGQLLAPNASAVNLSIEQAEVHLNATGQIRVQDRSLAIKDGGTLSAGNIVLEDTPSAGTPNLTFGGSSRPFTFRNGVTISDEGDEADLFIGNGFGPQPDVSIEGQLVIDIDGDQSNARIRVPAVTDGSAEGTLLNLGKLTLERSAAYSVLIENEGALTIAATTTMFGGLTGGSVFNRPGASVDQTNTMLLGTGNVIANSGLWRFPGSGRVQNSAGVDPNTTGFVNHAQMHATSGTTTIETRFTNLGFVLADGGHLVFTNATTLDVNNRRVLNGNWRTVNNGTISVPQDPPTVLAGGTTRVSGEQKRIDFLGEISDIEDGARLETGDLDRDGDLRLDSGNLEVTEAGNVGINGDIDMQNGSAATVHGDGSLGATQEINVGNDDPIAPSVLDNLQGSIALARGTPSPPSISASAINVFANLTPIRDDAGVMNSSGLLTIYPTGTLRINAEADGVCSGLVHSGDLDIQGSISVERLGAYEPAPGDRFVVATVSGTIHALPPFAEGDLGPGLVYAVSGTGGSVVVTVTASCPADLAAPFGTLNFFDIAAYLTLFNTGDLQADLAAPFGTLNFFDLAAYLAQYNAGCP